MILDYISRIGRGGHGDVFARDWRAYKLFHAHEGEPYSGTWAAAQSMFERQVAAQEFIAKNPELARYAPAYYGTVRIESVMLDGEDRIANYHPDLCFVTEHIPFDEDERFLFKSYDDPAWAEHRDRMGAIAKLFEDAGLPLPNDTTVMHWRAEFPKLVDIPMPETPATAVDWKVEYAINMRDRAIRLRAPSKADRLVVMKPGPGWQALYERRRIVIEEIEAELEHEALQPAAL